MRYYDFDGQPIDQSTFLNMLDHPGRTVGQSMLPNEMWVSTLWTGVNQGPDDGPLEIYESTVYPTLISTDAIDSRRYANRTDARAGHDELVALWSRHDSASRSRHPTS